MFEPNNDDIETVAEEALGLINTGHLREGEIKIGELLRCYPFSPFTHFAMGVVHALQGKYESAINSFNTASSINSEYIEAHFNKAVAYKKQFDLENMIKSFQEVIRRGRPDDGLVFEARHFLDDVGKGIQASHGIDLETYLVGHEIFDKAFSCMEKKEWEEALQGFKACIGKIKNHHQSYGNMGLCWAMLGQKTKSLEALNKALEIDPSYEPAIENKILVENLKEGERLKEDKFYSLDYSKEKFLRSREMKK